MNKEEFEEKFVDYDKLWKAYPEDIWQWIEKYGNKQRIAERENIKQFILSHSGYGDDIEAILRNIAEQLTHLTTKELEKE